MIHTNQPSQTVADPSPTGKGGEIALDIEAINLVDEPELDFQSPNHWSLFCVPVGHRSEGRDTVETRVLWRQGPTTCDELNLIERVVAWIRDREPTTLVTYNGDSYDLPILRERARTAAHECPGTHSVEDDLEMVLRAVGHEDLFTNVKERVGSNVPLDSALNYHGIQTPDVELNGVEVTGANMPKLGIKILAGDASDVELKAVRDYAESDVEPLFALYDALRETAE